MKVRDVTEVLESFAPLSGAESWDNVGLIVGAPSWSATRVMLTIDLTRPVLDEAIAAKTRLVVAYHPLIFDPIRAVTDSAQTPSLVLDAIRAGIAVHSPHTALDAAPGGVNDWLAEAVGGGDVRALDVHAAEPTTETHKIVTFCPREAADRIRDALAAAGAGRIGAYERCSFEISGTGTFMGSTDTHPAVGRAGVLERVDEVRLEMVCSAAALALAVTTLREFHPYEEPPIEIYALQPRPRRDAGVGRRVMLDRKVGLRTITERLKKSLGVRRLRVAPGQNAPRSIGTVGLCAGAGGSLLGTAIEQGCELFVTGEMRHHDVLAAQAAGCTIVLAGHTNTERGYLKRLRRVLVKALPALEVRISRRDGDPLREI
ncbi:MAG: Nif3-like dinuclear metal center hexameric protein [Planctomycetes bacterium]|nr:Nif3-like dinuclear metal center hexameric protein [Planctomycetota bacterium]